MKACLPSFPFNFIRETGEGKKKGEKGAGFHKAGRLQKLTESKLGLKESPPA